MERPRPFRGTAAYYTRGRPPYSAQLTDVLAAHLRLDGRGRLLDVGSGPGTVGVLLAPLFEHVTFVEPDPDMLAEARAQAATAGLTATDFVHATAEDLAGVALPPVRVATFGQSFHRTDRLRTADTIYDLLEPGGSMVLLSHDASRPAPPPPADTVPVPHGDIGRLIRAFLGDDAPPAPGDTSPRAAERFEETLARTRFGRPVITYAPGRPDIVRDADSVVANYLSMSYAAPPLFGPRLPEFVARLRALLAERAPNERFWDWPGDTELVIATKA